MLLNVSLKTQFEVFFVFFYDVEFNSSFELLYRLLFQEEYQVKYWFVYLQISHESKLHFLNVILIQLLKTKEYIKYNFYPPYKTVW